jgi:phosphonoacetaldehyde hydrolase
MGTHKRTHIEKMTEHPDVVAAWRAAHGASPTSADVDAMFEELEPLMIATLPAYATPIAGCLETVAALRARSIKIGSTTGYTRKMLDVLAPASARLGYAPDVSVTADEVARARPYPDMCLRNVMALGVSSVDACVKVDDTVAGIEEGLRAGMWTVGVVMTGNEVGCDAATLAAMPETERARLRRDGYAKLRAAGAHVVIDGIADLIGALDDLRDRTTTPRAA